jgi:anti-sigma-K factor RskA
VSHADIEDLAGLALEHDDASAEVRRHVESCPECSDVVAALAAARGLAGEAPLVAPPPHVREQVMAHVRPPAAAADVVPDPIPFPSRPSGPPRRRVSVWVAAVAAGLALVAGLGLGRLTGEEPPAPEAVDPTPGTVVAAADLTALDSDAPRGVASAVEKGDTITLRVSAEALGDQAGVHEVWLINVDGKRMVAVGLLASGDTGQFEVPMGLIEEGYRIVDISVEPDDGDPTHSGVSLARGELA